MSTRHHARRAIVQALYQWDLTQQAADEIEASFSQIHDLQNVDKRFFRRVLKELPQVNAELVTNISEFIERDINDLDPIERNILKLGAFELGYRADVPTNVVINEMIELAKLFGADQSYKFVNSVMDKLAARMRPS